MTSVTQSAARENEGTETGRGGIGRCVCVGGDAGGGRGGGEALTGRGLWKRDWLGVGRDISFFNKI